MSKVTTEVSVINLDGAEFKIGDRLVTGNIRRTIGDFDIKRNALYIESTAGRDIHIADTVKFVEPTVAAPTNKTLEQIEEDIRAKYPRPIKLERLLKRRTETLKEFLIKFFKGNPNNEILPWNDTRNTIYVDDSTVQTPMEKRRSLGDIYMICKYYYPNCTLQEVVKLLYVTLIDELDEGMRTSYCNTIRKRVWYYSFDTDGGVYNEDTVDEYGNKFNFYIGG